MVTVTEKRGSSCFPTLMTSAVNLIAGRRSYGGDRLTPSICLLWSPCGRKFCLSEDPLIYDRLLASLNTDDDGQSILRVFHLKNIPISAAETRENPRVDFYHIHV